MIHFVEPSICLLLREGFLCPPREKYKGRRGKTPLSLKLETRWSGVGNWLQSWEMAPILFSSRMRGPPKAVRTFWRRQNSFDSTGIRTADRPARSLVAIPTELPRPYKCFERRN